ncbi:MAG: tRNA 2-thiocytidine(32) synthetase TtcA [Deltaproteobacteria bacterium]|uniref:tRNA 2-thiocytidine(32) synthetase TtcA n=1 Tax=Candidatus Zymogenus saltonus TaxID=2844893 RepID=A0A9D8PPC2_9DELT|nr:tRNA 2-thiocytidine(32) synthetase TtcA [Candidatus Zymogenus saltonus]
MTILQKTEKALDSHVGKAIIKYGMIRPNDVIMVAFSGGKDSWALLFTLRRLMEKAPVKFSIKAVHVDVGFPGTDTAPIEEYLDYHKFDYEILRTGIYKLTKMKLSPDQNPCPFCARMRRGALYGRANGGGFTTIALGHHREDLLETLLMNLFFNGLLRAMAPRYVAKDYGYAVIRPMVFVEERLISRYARLMDFPIVDICPHKAKAVGKRSEMKELISNLERKYPKIKKIMFRALGNVDADHLMDETLYGFKSLGDGIDVNEDSRC